MADDQHQQVSTKEQDLLFGGSDSENEGNTPQEGHNALSESDWASQQDWEKLQRGFLTTGFREGIDSGKEESVQSGFNDGFRHGIYRGFMKGKMLARLRMEKLTLEKQGLETDKVDALHRRLQNVDIRTGLKYQALEEQESVADQLAVASGESTIRVDNAGDVATHSPGDLSEGLPQFKSELGGILEEVYDLNGAHSFGGRSKALEEILDRNCPQLSDSDHGS
eukprot:gb/GECG01010448.1/.p1 GENE.gb/GECG01010448.1/~~gb/GECG01010448.1/.p1  ORF type:complete len:223 (+),score=40.32 gb/GECG01010448.1/:1-669(+)